MRRQSRWISPGSAFRRTGSKSSRTALARYEAALAKLRDAGRVYACYETEDELERKRRRQLGRGMPPIYDRAALSLSAEDRAKSEAEGRKPYWRFKLDHRAVKWDDLVRGEISIDTATLSDPVVSAGGRHLALFDGVGH